MTDKKIKPEKDTKEDINRLYELMGSASKVIKENEPIRQLGCLHFNDTKSSDEKPFVRVDHTVNPADLVRKVFFKQWKVKQPRIVVFMLSNIAPLREWKNLNQIKHFQKGVMKAADNTNMWLITNAINLGFSQIIGEAVHNEIQVIKRSRNRSSHGISKLNFFGVANQSQLRYGDSIATSKDFTIQIPNDDSIKKEIKPEFELNKDFTHYIIVKDSENHNGINNFLLDLMKYANETKQNKTLNDTSVRDNVKSIKKDSDDISGIQIPVVSIVIQGGFETSRLVLDQIKQKIPVLVLGGSGGLADLLAFVEYEIRERCIEVWDPDYIESYIKPELTFKIITRFSKLRDNALLCNLFRDRILECVRESRKDGHIYLSVINMYNSYSSDLENLSEHLLLAVFKSRYKEDSNQDKSDDTLIVCETFKVNPEIVSRDLFLCVDWNCPDVAKKEVINKDPKFGINLDKKMFEEALTRTNRCDFIDLFMSNGFHLRSFVNPRRLRKMFKKIHSNDFFRSVCWEGVLGLSSDMKQSVKFIDRELNWLMYACTGVRNFFDEQELNLFFIGQYPHSPEEAERKALAIVLIWGLFHYRKRLVQILWKHSDQPILVGLIIATIYDRLSYYITEEGLKLEMQTESKLYTSNAFNILDICYKDSTDRAEDALNETSHDWNYRSPVDIAANAGLRAFLSHPSCQKWLTDTFHGNLRIRETQIGFIALPVLVKIILSALFMFPMYFWIRFKDTNERNKNLKEVKDVIDREDEEDVDTVEGNQQNDKRTNKRNQQKLFNIPEEGIIIRKQPPPWVMAYELWNAPITKFWISQFFYVIYLALFSLAVIYPKCGNFVLDSIVWIWTFSLTLDMIRRTYTYHKKYTNLSIRVKITEIVGQVLFLMAYGSHRLLYKQTFRFITPYYLKVIMCIDLIYAFFVLFRVYLPISATLGPLLYRLKIMFFIDFLNFLRMCVLLMVSFGIVIQSLLFPDQELSTELFRTTFHRAFFSLFLTPVDDLVEDKSCDRYLRDNNTAFCVLSSYSQDRCPNTGFWPYLIFAIYLVLLKLLLTSVLFAIFASTASKTADTDNIWKFQRYILVMDFVDHLPLPPPFNLIYYMIWAFKWITYVMFCYIPKQTNSKNRFGNLIRGNESNVVKLSKLLSEDDYSYFKSIAFDYFDGQENKRKSETIASHHLEQLQTNGEELEFHKKLIKQMKSKLSETDKSVRESLAHLEAIKHMVSREFGMDYEMKSTKTHIISRHTPYPHTSVQRYPVPDKYVSWDVMFIAYDPVVYSKPIKEFDNESQQYADEDLLKLQEVQVEDPDKKLPKLDWNKCATNVAGITINRQTWEVKDKGVLEFYMIDNGVPRNPMGRTGLRGRGSLLRWGPNHYVMVVITRIHEKYEVVVELKDTEITTQEPMSLLTSFIPGELTYVGIEAFFKVEEEYKGWTNSDKMIAFMENCVNKNDKTQTTTENNVIVPQSGLKYEIISKGYTDASLNTDHAWKEVELWHFHYTKKENLESKMNKDIEWTQVKEDFFAQLVLTQSHLLKDILDKFRG